jgi:hypothetical protein
MWPNCRALLAAEAEIGSIEIQVGFLGRLRRHGDAFSEPDSGKQATASPNRAADANLTQPGAPLRWIAERVPGPPGQLHRLLNGVLGFLGIPQDGIGDGEQPAALGVDDGLKSSRRTRRPIVSHDHETVEPA